MWKIIIAVIDAVCKWFTYKARSERKQDQILHAIVDLNRRTLRLEICEAMRRNDRAVVHQLYDEYKRLGGNSYMQELYKKYTKKGVKL